MVIQITNHFTDETKIFDSTKGNLVEELLLAYPWLRSPMPEFNDLESILEELEATHLEVDVSGQPEELTKAQKDWEEQQDHVLNAMLGHNKRFHKYFKAASFLAGGYEPNLKDIRTALYQADNDPMQAALVAHKLPNTPENIKAVEGLQELNESGVFLAKFEPGLAEIDQDNPLSPKDVEPFRVEGKETAKLVQRAFEDHFVVPVKLNGKHAKGTLLARDNESGKTFLLKPGSSGQSPAYGASQELASQSQREAAFCHEAKLLGLESFVPKTDLLLIDQKQYAAIQLLPWDFKTLDDRRAKGASPERILKTYLNDGLLHRWAVLDYIFGNPDRHANNIMVNEGGQVMLIDHGSAFAGKDFDPAKDQNSFTPFYLRAWAPKGGNFNSMQVEDKLKVMPRLPESKAKELKEWIVSLNSNKIKEIMVHYGIDPEPALIRLAYLKALVTNYSADLAILKVWVDSA